ncbi:Cylicin-2, partial [Ophiophagus hannah]
MQAGCPQGKIRNVKRATDTGPGLEREAQNKLGAALQKSSFCNGADNPSPLIPWLKFWAEPLSHVSLALQSQFIFRAAEPAAINLVFSEQASFVSPMPSPCPGIRFLSSSAPRGQRSFWPCHDLMGTEQKILLGGSGWAEQGQDNRITQSRRKGPWRSSSPASGSKGRSYSISDNERRKESRKERKKKEGSIRKEGGGREEERKKERKKKDQEGRKDQKGRNKGGREALGKKEGKQGRRKESRPDRREGGRKAGKKKEGLVRKEGEREGGKKKEGSGRKDQKGRNEGGREALGKKEGKQKGRNKGGREGRIRKEGRKAGQIGRKERKKEGGRDHKKKKEGSRRKKGRKEVLEHPQLLETISHIGTQLLVCLLQNFQEVFGSPGKTQEDALLIPRKPPNQIFFFLADEFARMGTKSVTIIIECHTPRVCGPLFKHLP